MKTRCIPFKAGYYDVVVENPDGQEGRLAASFTVVDPNPSVTGGGASMLVFGLAMGLLSLAGSGSLSRRRKMRIVHLV